MKSLDAAIEEIDELNIAGAYFRLASLLREEHRGLTETGTIIIAA